MYFMMFVSDKITNFYSILLEEEERGGGGGIR